MSEKGNRWLLLFLTRGRRPWLAAAVLVLAVLIVFGQTRRFQFLTWDDQQHVLANPLVNPPTWHGIYEGWRHSYWGLYCPLSYTFFAGEAAIARRPGRIGGAAALRADVFHLGNVVLHAVCVVLVFAILRRLLDLAAAAGDPRHPGPARAVRVMRRPWPRAVVRAAPGAG